MVQFLLKVAHFTGSCSRFSSLQTIIPHRIIPVKKIALLVRLSETKNKDADFEGNLC